MAKTVKAKSELKRNKRTSLLKSAMFLVLMIISVIVTAICFYKTSNIKFALLLFVGLAFFICYKNEHKKYMIMNSGVKGETKVLEILKKLPSDFTVITNPVIENRGKYNELDFAVIHNGDIFIIETKNYRGILKGKVSDKEITQIKLGKGGAPYEKTVKNPIGQAEMQIRRMRELLYDMNLKFSVFSVLYFTDGSIKTEFVNDKFFECRIIKSENELLNYIIGSNTGNMSKSSDIKKLIEVLKR